MQTTKEIREKIAVSDDPDWFNSQEGAFKVPINNFETKFKGVSSVYDFFAKEINGWDELGKNIPEQFKASLRFAQFIIQQVEKLFNPIYSRKAEWNLLLQKLKESNNKLFLRNSSEVEHLLQIRVDFPESFESAVGYFLNSINNTFADRNNLIGTLLAYEFALKDHTSVLERKDKEKKSLSRLRIDLQDYLSKTEKEVSEYIAKTREAFDKYAQIIDDTKGEKEKSFDIWFIATQKSFGDFDSIANEKIKELENLYREKLKLEAPAKYWSNRAEKLRGEGMKWLNWLIGFIAFGIVLLVAVLGLTANGTIDKIFDSTATAIKWSVGFVTLISFIAFGIRVFSKLTFSSFHLVRDAEEREQLTYVYLALQKEKGIDETERHLIMQSLFSRADSGLLKDDGSPTMPGGILDKLSQNR